MPKLAKGLFMILRKILRNTLFFSTIMLGLLSVSAEEKQNNNTIKLGYSTTQRTFIENMNSRYAKGYGYEIFKKIEEVSDFQFTFVAIEGSLTEAVENGTVDMAGFSIQTDARTEKVLYSQVEFGKISAALLTNDSSILYNDPQSIDGKTVATYKDNIAQAELERYCDYYDISVEYVYDTISNYMYLDTDYYIGYAKHVESENKNNVLNLGVYNLYMTTDFNNKETLDTLDIVFSDVISTEGNFFLELEEKYLSHNIELNHRSLNKKELAKLQERPLQVGYVSDYAPISYQNEYGEPDGAMVDTLNMFSKQHNFEVVYHPYSLSDNPNSRKDFDILLTIYGDGIFDFEHYDTTEAYYVIPMYAQVHADRHTDNSNIGKIIENSSTIGMLPYETVSFDNFLNAFPHNKIVFFDDWHQLLDSFAKGSIDMLVSTESSTSYAELYLEDTSRLTIHTDFEVPMQFFVSKNIADEYMSIFNVLLDTVSREVYRSIINSSSNTYYPKKTLLDYIKDDWGYAVLFITVIIVLFLLYAYRQQQKKQHIIVHAYNTDALTGFMAMHAFNEKLDSLLQNSKPSEYELISLDIDMFKTINTHYSTEKGTNVILAISNALKKAFEHTTILATRRSADHFILVRKMHDGGTIKEIYIRYILPYVRNVIGEKYNLSMSFGSVCIDDCSEKPSALIGHADTARTTGKGRHHTTFITFDKKMKKLYNNKINITLRMEQASQDKEFRAVYQPKVNLATQRIDGAEALVRWQTQQGDTLYPDEFIPVFEENGFISYLDLYVLEEVCIFIITNKNHIDIPRISVNLSAYTVLDDTIEEKILAILSKYNIQTSEIELEITESAIVDNESTFLKRIKKLKNHGFVISIDDFGAGVSSLNRLNVVDADILKFDKVFFSESSQDARTKIVVQDLIALAEHLEMKVVAEGIETQEQALWLKNLGCTYAQGYYFEKPVEKEVFKQMLVQKKVYELKT